MIHHTIIIPPVKQRLQPIATDFIVYYSRYVFSFPFFMFSFRFSGGGGRSFLHIAGRESGMVWNYLEFDLSLFFLSFCLFGSCYSLLVSSVLSVDLYGLSFFLFLFITC